MSLRLVCCPCSLQQQCIYTATADTSPFLMGLYKGYENTKSPEILHPVVQAGHPCTEAAVHLQRSQDQLPACNHLLRVFSCLSAPLLHPVCLLLPSSYWLMGKHWTGSGLCAPCNGPANWTCCYHGNKRQARRSGGTEGDKRGRWCERSELTWWI